MEGKSRTGFWGEDVKVKGEKAKRYFRSKVKSPASKNVMDENIIVLDSSVENKEFLLGILCLDQRCKGEIATRSGFQGENSVLVQLETFLTVKMPNFPVS